MRVIFDLQTRQELGPASEELEAKYLEARRNGKNFLEIVFACCNRKIAVIHKAEPKRTPKPEGYIPHPPFYDPAIHRAPPLPERSP